MLLIVDNEADTGQDVNMRAETVHKRILRLHQKEQEDSETGMRLVEDARKPAQAAGDIQETKIVT
jgi:hypothetical protein